MVRQYDSSRRKNAAEQTRQEILQAALKLHWEGITEFEPLAREANCSLATLRKNFPTKEAIFQNCTRTFAETLVMPDLEAIGAISEPEQRVEQGIAELCRIHEAMFGYAWLGAHQRKDSPTLEAEMKTYEGLADAMTEMITPIDSEKSSLVRGLLDFLTYRALRLAGGLSPAKCAEELISMIQQLIPGDINPPSKSTAKRAQSHES